MKRHDPFVIDAQIKIKKVLWLKEFDGHILADLVTEQFGRRVERRHYFSKEVWDLINERGYIE